VGLDGEVIVTTLANERDRLASEELGADVIVIGQPWHEPLPAAADGVLKDTEVAAALRAARAGLLPGERARYGALGSELAQAVTRILTHATPEQTERALAAQLVSAVVEIGAEPVVILVGGEARLGIPHPLPTTGPLGRRAIVAVGARRTGLIANLTRTVAWGLGHENEGALRDVEADAIAATVAGRELRDVLHDIADSYDGHGLGANAWQRHHQGGPTGYLGRDPKVTPESRELVVEGQAFAWNPWIPGAKAEDTVIIDRDGVEVLTADPDWPCIEVGGISRPLTLDLA